MDRTFSDLYSDRLDCRPLSLQAWDAKFGIDERMVTYVWNTYCAPSDLQGLEQPSLRPLDPLALLLAVGHLKEYRKESAVFADWKMSKPTYRNHWQNTTWYLALNMTEVLLLINPEVNSCGLHSRRPQYRISLA
jgi:hypothetical protein